MAITRLGPNNSTNISGVNLTSQVTGTLPTGNGGSGRTAVTGNILQVVSAVKTDTFSTTSQSDTAVTGLSVAITPSSTSSKILVMVQICLGTGSYTALYSLRRGSTDILLADAASNRARTTAVINPRDTDTNRMNNAIPTTFLDSPNTTSATTYQAYIKCRSSGHTIYVNRSANDNDASTYDPRTTSTITVMEIAG